MKWAFKDARNAAFLFIAFRFVCPLEILRPSLARHRRELTPANSFVVPTRPAINPNPRRLCGIANHCR